VLFLQEKQQNARYKVPTMRLYSKHDKRNPDLLRVVQFQSGLQDLSFGAGEK